jgi:hypothetical protein
MNLELLIVCPLAFDLIATTSGAPSTELLSTSTVAGTSIHFVLALVGRFAGNFNGIKEAASSHSEAGDGKTRSVTCFSCAPKCVGDGPTHGAFPIV